MKANKERIIKEFSELIAIDAESLNERNMADALKVKLEELGFDVEEDNVGPLIGGNAGNLFGTLKGNSDKPPILLSGHMDTVKPGNGKNAIFHEDGKITSDGTTILGSDDIAGVVEILEGVRLAKDSGKEMGDVEILFSVCEETYGKGARNFDYSKVKSRIAYALDLSNDTGIAATKAPSIVSFKAKVLGKAAHSGFEPEKGLNALQAAAKAISRIEQGHVGEMTVNIGTIKAGKANNIVSEECVVTGEVRGFDHQAVIDEVERIGEIFDEEAEKLILESAVGEGSYKADPNTGRKQGECQFDYTVNIRAFDIPHYAEVCTRFQTACSALGLSGDLVETHGGSDNAFFVEEGIDGIVLSCGMYNVHSVTEYSYVKDLIAGAELVAELLTN